MKAFLVSSRVLVSYRAVCVNQTPSIYYFTKDEVVFLSYKIIDLLSLLNRTLNKTDGEMRRDGLNLEAREVDLSWSVREAKLYDNLQYCAKVWHKDMVLGKD